ncbi:MAG: aspartate carbamoyltransferase regulatory subunit [bacterium]
MSTQKKETEKNKVLPVSAIKNGTVIDHIISESTLKVLQLLKLRKIDGIISVAYNLKSKSLGRKGIIKVEGKALSPREIRKIATIAPDSTLSVIEDYKVKEKRKLELPEEIISVVRCKNPNCITNSERVRTNFKVESKNPIKLRCTFCERTMKYQDIEIKK